MNTASLSSKQRQQQKNQSKRSYDGNKVTTGSHHHQNIEFTQASASSTTSNLDISKEDLLEILNSSSNDKFLIKWSNTYTDQAINNHLMSKVKPILHTKIVDYFATLPDFNGDNDSGGGFLTQACQTHSLRDMNEEPDVKKIKTCANDERNKKTMILNSLLSDMNEFNRLFSNEFPAQETAGEDDDLNNNKNKYNNKENECFDEDGDETSLFQLQQQRLTLSPTQLIPQQPVYESPSSFDSKSKLKTNNNKSLALLKESENVRTSTPRAMSKKSLFDEKAKKSNDSPIAKPPISDDSLVIALSQYENHSESHTSNNNNKKVTAPPPLPPKASTVKQQPQPAKKFNFNSNKPSTVAPRVEQNQNEKSFTRYKSDPLNNSSMSNRNRCMPSNTRSNTNYSSSQAVAAAIQDDDDDDDVNLLFNDQNLLKMIDSKATTANAAAVKMSSLNDTFNRNMVKKAPSLPQLQQSSSSSLNSNKMIQMPPSSKCNLKLQRMSSSDNVHTKQPTATNVQNNTNNKNFYGQQAPSQTATVKYTDEQIELKRQQALLRLKQNKK